MNIQDVREKFPGYEDLSDSQLADALHKKFYSDVPKDEFLKQIGLGEQSIGDKIEGGIAAAHKFITGANKPGGTGYTDKMMQGLTFGGADEARAGIRSVVKGKPYDQSLKEVREDEKAFDKRNPVGSVVSEIAGGAALGAPLKGISSVLGLTRAGAALPGWARAVGTGAASGATYGFGSGEGGFQNRAGNAARSGGFGAGMGLAGYGLSKGIGSAYGGAKRLLSGRKSSALSTLADDLKADSINPKRLASRLKQLGPNATIADAGKGNTLATARAALGGTGGMERRATLINRAQGESKRIGQTINKRLGPSDYFDEEDVLIGRLRANADVAYGKANPVPVSSPKLNEILSRKPIKSAINKAKELAEIEGRVFDIPDDVSRGIKTEVVDDIKKGIDSLLDSPRARNQYGKMSKYGMALNNLKKQLLEEVDGLNPLYKDARKIYGGDAEVLTSLKDGKNFLSLSPEQIKKNISKLSSEAARKAYRSGAARALVDKVDGVRDTAGAADRIFGDSITRDKIRAVMPDDASYRELARTLRSEGRFNKVKNTLIGGSDTQPKLKANAEMVNRLSSGAAVFGSSLPVGHSLVVAGTMRRLAQAKLNKILDKDTAELAHMLVSRDPARNAKVIDDLLKLYGPGGKTDMQPLHNAIARLAGQQTGLLD